MSNATEIYDMFFKNLKKNAVLQNYAKFLTHFKIPLNLAIGKYSNEMQKKKETWRDCNISYLRQKLKEHYIGYNLNNRLKGQEKIERLVNIVNYSLMLIIREQTLEADLLIAEKKKLDEKEEPMPEVNRGRYR